MTPKFTQSMLKDAIDDGAEVKEKRSMARPPPAPVPMVPDRGPELESLRGEVAQLKQTLAGERIAAERRSQELTQLFEALSENKPMRLKPIRDMNRESPTFLLVDYYDFIPVEYKRKLDS